MIRVERPAPGFSFLLGETAAGLFPLPARHDPFHAAACSGQPGGVNALLVDGHVIFTSDTIELVIWLRLAASNDVSGSPGISESGDPSVA